MSASIVRKWFVKKMINISKVKILDHAGQCLMLPAWEGSVKVTEETHLQPPGCGKFAIDRVRWR